MQLQKFTSTKKESSFSPDVTSPIAKGLKRSKDQVGRIFIFFYLLELPLRIRCKIRPERIGEMLHNCSEVVRGDQVFAHLVSLMRVFVVVIISN